MLRVDDDHVVEKESYRPTITLYYFGQMWGHKNLKVMTIIGKFGIIGLAIELTMKTTLTEPCAKCFFEILILFSHIRIPDYRTLTLLVST